MDTIQALNWRYATKIYDTTKKIKDHDLHELLEALRLSPSSFGLQPWKFLMIEDQELRAKLRAAAWNQPQVTDASHFFVLCGKKMTPREIQQFVDHTATVRGVDSASLDGFKNMLLGAVAGKTQDEIDAWSAKQVYIALGTILTVAAMKGIDASPMEGFDNKAFDEILGLKDKGLYSVVLCAVGYRSDEDKYAHAKKVRYPASDVIKRM